MTTVVFESSALIGGGAGVPLDLPSLHNTYGMTDERGRAAAPGRIIDTEENASAAIRPSR
jgi:hypothetical protein